MDRKIILMIRRDRSYYLHGSVMKHMHQYMYAWNFFFKLSYIEFRKKLSDISSSSYSRGKFDQIYLWAGKKEYQDVNQEGNIIVSIDEDDWISNSLTSILRDFDFQDMPVVIWKVMHLRCNINSPIYYSKWSNTPSCGYAIKTPYHYMKSSQYSYMMHYGENRKNHIKLDKLLAVKLDNYSSISFAEDCSINNLVRISKNKYFVTPNEDLQEYEQQVDLYNELLKELYGSCKI